MKRVIFVSIVLAKIKQSFHFTNNYVIRNTFNRVAYFLVHLSGAQILSDNKTWNVLFISLVQLTVDASKNLVDLDLTGLFINEQIASDIVKILGNNLRLMQKLIMNECNLHSQTVIKLLNELQVAVNMKELQMCNNQITDEVTVNYFIYIYMEVLGKTRW